MPVDVRFMARYDDEHGWHDVEFDEVALDQDEDEHDHRLRRLPAAEALHYDRVKRTGEAACCAMP